MGLAITALFGFVGYILSWGLFVPSDLKPFNLVGVVASMAGYAVGIQASKSNKLVGWKRAGLIALCAVSCLACLIAYVIFVQRGSGETSEVIFLALLLFGAFFSLTFLMPLAGVSIKQ